MLAKTIKLILVLSIFISCKNESNKTIAASGKDSTHINFQKNIDAIVQDYIDLDIFSGVILVMDEGNNVYHKAFGLADRDTRTPNTVNTLFDIGSMNKTFTSIVIHQLAIEGKLQLTDKLVDYVKGFKDPNVNKITINHLLNHESGFGDYHTPNYFDLPIKQRELQAIVERAKSTELNFEPGTENDYSNLGYVILGAVIEKVIGKSYFEAVRERIVKPLGLKNTYVNNFEGLESRTAKGYLYSPLGALEENESSQDPPNPDGGFLSTTEDIFKFYNSYYKGSILFSEQEKAQIPMFQHIEQIPTGQATGAAGGFPGFNTALYYVPSKDLMAIVFANMDEPVAELIGSDILTIMKGETPKKPQLPAIQNVRKAYENHGADYIKANFKELITNYHPTDPKDFILNDLGYAYLYGAKDIDKALEIFKLNTELFPGVANCWDSYGETLSSSGKTEEAIAAYEHALSIRPNLESSKVALATLKNKK